MLCLSKVIFCLLVWLNWIIKGQHPKHCLYALFTAAPSLIFNENESESVRDRFASLQWAVLLFNVFLDCSAHETVEQNLSKKMSVPDNVSCGKL